MSFEKNTISTNIELACVYICYNQSLIITINTGQGTTLVFYLNVNFLLCNRNNLSHARYCLQIEIKKINYELTNKYYWKIMHKFIYKLNK